MESNPFAGNKDQGTRILQLFKILIGVETKEQRGDDRVRFSTILSRNRIRALWSRANEQSNVDFTMDSRMGKRSRSGRYIIALFVAQGRQHV